MVITVLFSWKYQQQRRRRVESPVAIASNLHHTIGGNNLNINLPDNNAVLRLEVELRDKHARRRPNNRHKGFTGDGRNRAASPVSGAAHQTPPNPNNFFIPMEKVRKLLIVLQFVVGVVGWPACFFRLPFREVVIWNPNVFIYPLLSWIHSFVRVFFSLYFCTGLKTTVFRLKPLN